MNHPHVRDPFFASVHLCAYWHCVGFAPYEKEARENRARVAAAQAREAAQAKQERLRAYYRVGAYA